MTIPDQIQIQSRTSNYVLTDGLMIFLNSRKGDMYDFCKSSLQNQLYKRLLNNNKYAIEYIHNFNDDLSTQSHCSSNLAHHYATTGNLEIVKTLLHFERVKKILPKDSLFN